MISLCLKLLLKRISFLLTPIYDAQKLATMRFNVANINTVLEDRMQQLDAAKKKYQATKDRLTREVNEQDRLESGNKVVEGEYK